MQLSPCTVILRSSHHTPWCSFHTLITNLTCKSSLPQPAQARKYWSAFCLCKFAFSRFFTEMDSYTLQSFVSCCFYLVQCFLRFFCFIPHTYQFLLITEWFSTVGCTMFCLSTHQLIVHLGCFQFLEVLWIMFQSTFTCWVVMWT